MIGLQRLLDNKSHVIWDWNGTLLNDVDLAVQSICDLLEAHQLPLITREGYRRAFSFPVSEYYRNLGFDFEKTPFTEIAEEFIQRFNAGVTECPLFEGTHTLLGELKAAQIGMSVLSAAQQQDLEYGIKTHGLDGFFHSVQGIEDRFAASKVERGQKLLNRLKSHRIKRESILMFGDTDHDVEVAHELGIDMILLGDGHQCANKLSRIRPDVIRCRYSDPRVVPHAPN